MTINGLSVDHVKTLTLVAHKNLKDRAGASSPAMAETRMWIKIRDRFVGERVSVARAQFRAVMEALAAHEAETGRKLRRYGHIV